MTLRCWSSRFVSGIAALAALLCPVVGWGQTPPPAAAGIAAATPQAAKPVPPPSVTRVGDHEWGIAVKRPVLQAACKYCPWGSLAEIVKKMMAPYGFEVGICHSCSPRRMRCGLWRSV